MSFGDGPVGVNSLGSTLEDLAEIFFEFDRCEVRIKFLSRQIAKVLGIFRSVVAANAP